MACCCKPSNFIKKSPIHTSEVLPDNVCFAWSVAKGEENDTLSYEIYIGRNASKEKLSKFKVNPEKTLLCLSFLSWNIKNNIIGI